MDERYDEVSASSGGRPPFDERSPSCVSRTGTVIEAAGGRWYRRGLWACHAASTVDPRFPTGRGANAEPARGIVG